VSQKTLLATASKNTLLIMANVFDLFAASPFGYLQQHMTAARACFALVPELFAAIEAGDHAKAEAIKSQIDELEHAADKITKTIRAALYGDKLMLALPTDDVLALVRAIDDLADRTQDIAVAATLRPLDCPPALAKAVDELVARSVKTCELVAEAVESIDQMLASSFAAADVQKIIALTDAARLAEHETDVAGIAAAKLVYQLEKELGAVGVFRWDETIKKLGWLADAGEHLAKIIFATLVKHSTKS
jgi:predicted phosphate transport protein (TIGR00153 family)